MSTFTKTWLIWGLAFALPGFGSLWLTTGFSVAPVTSMLVAILGAAATGVVVNTLFSAKPTGSRQLLHETAVTTGVAPPRSWPPAYRRSANSR